MRRRPNLTYAQMTKALAVLGSSTFLVACAKDSAAPNRATPSAIADPTPTPDQKPIATPIEKKPDEGQAAAPDPSASAVQVDGQRSKMHGGPGGTLAPAATTTGQASCGNGTCSAEMQKKKK